MDVDYRAEAAKSKSDKIRRMMGPESMASEAGAIAREEETRPSSVDKKTKIRARGGCVKGDKKPMMRMDKAKRARGGSVKTGDVLESKVHSGDRPRAAYPKPDDMSSTEQGLRGLSPIKKVESKSGADKPNADWRGKESLTMAPPDKRTSVSNFMAKRTRTTRDPDDDGRSKFGDVLKSKVHSGKDRRANGGRVKGGKGTTVNIVMPQQGGAGAAGAAGAPPPVMLPPAPNPIAPPPGGPPMGAGMGSAGPGPMAARPPMGGGMPGAPGMRKRGGRVELTAGAGSGLGRLEKTAALEG